MTTDPVLNGLIVAAVLFAATFVTHVAVVAWRNRPSARHRKEES